MSHVKFPYHPNIYQLEFGPIERNKDGLVCQVCGCVPDLYLDSMYATEEIDCLCLECVASGAAADKFDGDIFKMQNLKWSAIRIGLKTFSVPRRVIAAGRGNIG